MGTENWMENIKDKTVLRHITIPGSHDAGVTADKHSGKMLGHVILPSKTYICQDLRIVDQLLAGSRFLDLRFVWRTGRSMRAYHAGVRAIGGWGDTYKHIFDQICNFLRLYRSETVIARVSHTSRNDALKIPAYLKSANLGAYMYEGTGVNLAYANLGSMRGQVVIIYGTKEFPKGWGPSKSMLGYKKHGALAAGESLDNWLRVCGIYDSKQKSIEDVWNNAISGASAHEAHTRLKGGRDHLCQIYWQHTVGAGDIKKSTVAGCGYTYPKMSYRTADCVMRDRVGTHGNLSHLLKKLAEWDGMGRRKPRNRRRPTYLPNIIGMDFVHPWVCKDVINFCYDNLSEMNLLKDRTLRLR